MPRVTGIDHLVLSVGNFARSKEFYTKVLGFLGFKLKYEYDGAAGWSNRAPDLPQPIRRDVRCW